MKRLTRALALILAATLVTFAPLAAEAGSKTRVRSKIVGHSAVASWDYTQGDILTFVNVVVTDNNLSGTDGRSQDAFVSLAISQSQISTGNVLIAGVAYVEGPSNFDFSVDKDLGTAILRVRNAIFQDDNSFTFFNVDMDLMWTATAAATTLKSNDKFTGPGFRFKSHFQGTFRDGEATGSIFGKNIQFTPMASSSAQLQYNKFGSMEVTTQTP